MLVRNAENELRKGAWEKNGNHWQRDLIGTERFWYSNTSQGTPKWSIIPTLLVEVELPIELEMMTSIMQRAWRETLLRVPVLTYKGAGSIELNDFRVHYNQEINTVEVEEEFVNSFNEYTHSGIDNIEDKSKVLNDMVTKISYDGTYALLKCGYLVNVLYFTSGTKVTHLGLVGFADHTYVDGTGAYLCLHNYLELAVKSFETVKMKSKPEDTYWQLLPPEIRATNQSEQAETISSQYSGASSSHSVIPQVSDEKMKEKFEMFDVRHRFGKEETLLLLQKAKQLHLTITQLAIATSLIPMLRHFPVQDAATICFYVPFNMRPLLVNAPAQYYGNALSGMVIVMPCSLLSSNLCKGVCETVQDLESVISMAQHLKKYFTDFKNSKPLERSAAFSNRMDARLIPSKDEDADKEEKTKASNEIGIVSDGLLDRFIHLNYSGDVLSLKVIDVHLISNEPRASLSPRVSTFDGRLSLNYGFNNLAWKKEEVQRMLQEWYQILKNV